MKRNHAEMSDRTGRKRVPPRIHDCEIKKRRIGVWRRGGSLYVNLRGEPVREKAKAAEIAQMEGQILAAAGGFSHDPSIPPIGAKSVLDWQIPVAVAQSLHRVGGISTLYDWQDECLRQITGRSWSTVIYSAPTSGGKSLVADIVVLRRLIYQGHRALIVCPLVSICRERAGFLRSIVGSSGITIEEFHGPVSKSWNPGVDIAVCTVQKALGIINRLLSRDAETDDEEGSMKGRRAFSDLIGTVVVDEFHLVADTVGASVMESLVTRLGLTKDREKFLLVGMSATLPPDTARTTDQIRHWLECHAGNVLMYKCNFRPVDLNIFIKRNRTIAPLSGTTASRELVPLFDLKTDNDYFASLVNESFSKSVSTIVFCATRNWCENAASLLCRLLGSFAPVSVSPARIEMVEALRLLSPCGVHPILEQSIQLGIAFHHAGMTSEERHVIEVGFKNRTIAVLCATSTLSAGVNLPAERVILRTLTAASGGNAYGVTALSISAKMKQMVGRAGRAGHAARGEAIIMCASVKDEDIVRRVFSMHECLAGTAEGSRQILPPQDTAKLVAKEILEIAVFLKETKIEYFLEYFLPRRLSTHRSLVDNALQYLVRSKLVAIVQGSLIPTALGDALAHSAMPPDEAESVYRELSLARTKLCLAGGDIHLLFLVVPPVQVSESEFDEFVASNEVFSNSDIRTILADKDSWARRKRMMVALMLRDLTRLEGNIAHVASKYGVQTGTVQYLQANAATYCAMVSSFCDRLQWTSLAAALNSIKPRLHFGVPDELLGLMEVEGVSPARARALAKAGLTSVEKIALASPVQVAVAITRDVSLEGTQMTSKVTADRLVGIVATLIINNARISLGLPELVPQSVREISSFDSAGTSTSSIGILSSISPPLIHQLIGTQVQSGSDPPTPYENGLYHDHRSAGLVGLYRTSVAGPAVVESTPSEFYAHLLKTPRREALGPIDNFPTTVRQSSVRRRRRLSEMTTIEAGKHYPVDSEEEEFRLPSNNTATSFVDEDEIVFDSVLLRRFDP